VLAVGSGLVPGMEDAVVGVAPAVVVAVERPDAG
jgi:hypothetical protein